MKREQPLPLFSFYPPKRSFPVALIGEVPDRLKQNIKHECVLRKRIFSSPEDAKPVVKRVSIRKGHLVDDMPKELKARLAHSNNLTAKG